jgi:predicted metalloprotease with PDZ domain
MLGDMLPIFSVEGKPVSASVKLVLPNGWRSRADLFETSDVGLDVIAVGRNIEFGKVSAGIPLTVATYCTRDACGPVASGGAWHFTPEELDGFSSDIYAKAREVFGGDVHTEVFVNVFRFPFDPKMNPGSWQAETRGNNISIISSDMAFRTQSVQRLHEQLRHEMLHLWIPNGVALTGKYDWFYEGFVLYQALKIGVATNRISFNDYLDTLSRAKAIEARHEKRGSLIEASKERWRGAETYIYAKGMLVAFMCDVAMLDASNGKRSVTEIMRTVYARHKKGTVPVDGNDATLKILREQKELGPIADRYINGGDPLELDSYITKAGLKFAGSLKVSEEPNGRQRRILDALGYNNWRNIRR